MFRLAAFADEADKMLPGQIAALKRCGIELLEIRGVDGSNISDLTLSRAREVGSILKEHQITVSSVGSPIGKIEITADFEPHFDKYLRTLEIARILGAKYMRIFSFYHTDIPFSECLRDHVLERLSRFCEAAEGSSVTLCHENEKGIYGDTAVRCKELHRAEPGLRGVFDPANFACCGEDALSAWAQLSPYIEYLHIKDVAADGTIVPAGKGICHIAEIIDRYGQNGGGILSLEPHLTVFDGLEALEKKGDRSNVASYRYRTSDEAFDAAAEALKQIMYNATYKRWG